MSSRDLKTIIRTQKEFIGELLDRLSQRKELLNDPYFKGLSLEQILELAKKSIRLTGDNTKMRTAIEDSYEILCNYPQDERIALCVKYLGECSIL